MSSSDEKVIELSKAKIVLLILVACALLVVGGALLSLDDATIESHRRFNSPLLVHGIALVSIVLFATAGGYGIKKLFDRKPGLVLNSSGVMDNSSGVAAGLIPWAEILGAEIYEIHKQKMLIIKVRNPQQYIARGGILRRALNKASHKMCGSPIAISSSALKVNFSELVSLFEEYRQKYGNA